MDPRTEWFEKARYGMFVHWGAYSAGKRGEWVMNRERISKEEYIEKFVSKFTASDYDLSSGRSSPKNAVSDTSCSPPVTTTDLRFGILR